MNIYKTTTYLLITALLFSACSIKKNKADNPSIVVESLLDDAYKKFDYFIQSDRKKYTVMYDDVQKFRQKVKLDTKEEDNIDKIKDNLRNAIFNLFGNGSKIDSVLAKSNVLLIGQISEDMMENDIKIIELNTITTFWRERSVPQIPIDTMVAILTQSSNGSIIITNPSFWKSIPPEVLIENGANNYDKIPYINGMAVLDNKYLLNKSVIKGKIIIRGGRGEIVGLPFTKNLKKE